MALLIQIDGAPSHRCTGSQCLGAVKPEALSTVDCQSVQRPDFEVLQMLNGVKAERAAWIYAVARHPC